MILTNSDLEKRLVTQPASAHRYIGLWKEGNWAEIQKSIVIEPFANNRLESSTYDLSVGEWCTLLRKPDDYHDLRKGPVDVPPRRRR